MSSPKPLLECRDVRFGYEATTEFLGPISFSVEAGQRWAIVGPNGAGKSTLLQLLTGLLAPRGGSVHLGGKPLSALSNRERARLVSFLPQHSPEAAEFTIRDIVLMGRYPHRVLGLFESADDHRIACDAMTQTGVSAFADRTLGSVSGGEAQRAHLAAVLAQQAPIMLLDEPTASLDLKHQLAVFEILQRAVCDGRAAAVIVLHDINHAAMFCSHVALMHNGRLVASGDPASVLTRDRVESVYGVQLSALSLGDRRRWLVPDGLAYGPAASGS